MFTKKNMIVIALIAIFVMGVVALQASEISVYANRDGSGWWSLSNVNGGNPNYRNWDHGLNPVTNFYFAAFFECWGESDLGSDYDSGSVIPIRNYVFYLDLSGLEQIPDPESETE